VNRRHSRSLRESAGVLAELRRRNGLLFVVTLVHLGLAGLFTVLMQADGRMLLGQNVWAQALEVRHLDCDRHGDNRVDSPLAVAVLLISSVSTRCRRFHSRDISLPGGIASRLVRRSPSSVSSGFSTAV